MELDEDDQKEFTSGDWFSRDQTIATGSMDTMPDWLQNGWVHSSQLLNQLLGHGRPIYLLKTTPPVKIHGLELKLLRQPLNLFKVRTAAVDEDQEEDVAEIARYNL